MCLATIKLANLEEKIAKGLQGGLFEQGDYLDREREVPIESLGALAKTTGKSVMDKSPLKNIAESIFNRHASLGGISGNLDFFRVISVYHH
jgi:hypothetical protein